MKTKTKAVPPQFPVRFAIKQFFSQIFQEEDQKWSYSRVFGAIWLGACVTWISTYLSITHKLPDGGQLTGMSMVAGIFYTANKIGGAIQSISSGGREKQVD